MVRQTEKLREKAGNVHNIPLMGYKGNRKVTILKSAFKSQDNLVLFQYELQEILFNTRNWMPSIQLQLWIIHITYL
jgi:hypothetical protein